MRPRHHFSEVHSSEVNMLACRSYMKVVTVLHTVIGEINATVLLMLSMRENCLLHYCIKHFFRASYDHA